jgi:hypothetical protein
LQPIERQGDAKNSISFELIDSIAVIVRGLTRSARTSVCHLLLTAGSVGPLVEAVTAAQHCNACNNARVRRQYVVSGMDLELSHMDSSSTDSQPLAYDRLRCRLLPDSHYSTLYLLYLQTL